MTYPNPHARVDDHAAPIYYRLNGNKQTTTPEQFAQSLEYAFEWWRHLDHPVAWIADLRYCGTITAKHRREYAEFMNRIAPYQKKWLIATATIARNNLQRGIHTAVTWLGRLDSPHKSFLEVKEAVHWLREQLEAAGVDPGTFRVPAVDVSDLLEESA